MVKRKLKSCHYGTIDDSKNHDAGSKQSKGTKLSELLLEMVKSLETPKEHTLKGTMLNCRFIHSINPFNVDHTSYTYIISTFNYNVTELN